MGASHLNAARERLRDAEQHFTYQNEIIARLEAARRPIADAEVLLLRLRITVLREQETFEALLEGTASALGLIGGK